MKISIIAKYNTNMFPALYNLALQLAAHGADLQFISLFRPESLDESRSSFQWAPVRKVEGLASSIPILRSSHLGMVSQLLRFGPDLVIGELEYATAALLYGMLPTGKPVRVVGYFSDYINTPGMSHVQRLAGRLNAYVDVCHLRLEWRQRDWPQMHARTFLIRQAPLRRSALHIARHSGPLRAVYTGSRNVLSLNKVRLSRFFERLCEHGIAVDWYLVGTVDVGASEQLLAEARALTSHPLYAVRAPVPKAMLEQTLSQYDIGLFWAPMADRDAMPTAGPSYFLSAASNKIGEYIAAGLVVAHTGNPGLAYLPEAVCAVFDPTDPVAGADQLAAALADRDQVELRRAAALRYHLDEMNFEAQAAPLMRYIMDGA